MVIGALLILLILSGLFSATETGLVSLGKLKVKEIIEEKGIVGLRIWVDRPGEALSGIIIGNNIVNILFTVLFSYWALRSPVVVRLPAGVREAFILVVVSVIILLFGEIIPKTFAHSFAEKFVLLTYPFFSLSCALLLPLVKFATAVVKIVLGKKAFVQTGEVTRQELMGLVAEGREEGVIGEKMGEMARKVLTFDQIPVRNVMTKRENIDWVDINHPREKFIDLVVETGRSRVPVFSGREDNIIGMIYVKDIVKAWGTGKVFDIRSLLRPVYYVAGEQKCDEVFRDFRDKKIHLALILEKGKIVGLVTMEDLIEEITGEILDEFDLVRG